MVKSMKRIAVCDDEKCMRDQMREYLKDLEPVFQADYYESGNALLDAGIFYDVIFLDIDMRGLTGIDTARIWRSKDKKAKIIYVTAYEDFREYAFSVHAFGYLVKPVSREKIQALLQEAMDYEQEEAVGPKVRFQTDEGFREFPVRDICYFEYANRKIKLVTTECLFHMRGSIGDIAVKMESFGFAVPHKSFVVNLHHVKNLKGYDMFMTNGEILPLSQKKSAEFREMLTRWLAQQI